MVSGLLETVAARRRQEIADGTALGGHTSTMARLVSAAHLIFLALEEDHRPSTAAPRDRAASARGSAPHVRIGAR